MTVCHCLVAGVLILLQQQQQKQQQQLNLSWEPERMPEVVLNVEMACGGCSGAVERVLSKLPGTLGQCVSTDRRWLLARHGCVLWPRALPSHASAAADVMLQAWTHLT